MAEHVPNLGGTPSEDAQRDAVHVAVVPVKVARDDCRPGDRVGLVQSEPELLVSHIHDGDDIGVIDPFYEGRIVRGQRVWVFLNPGSAIGLRHVYRHPVLDADEIRRETIEALTGPAKKRLTEIFEEWGGTYEKGMELTERYLKTGQLIAFDGFSKGMNAEAPADFWPLYEAVTGKRVPLEKATDFFSCDCGGGGDFR